MFDSGSRTRVRGLVLAAVCAAALGLAACGDDDDDDTATTPTETEAVETTEDGEATTEDTTTEDAETTESDDTAETGSEFGEQLRSQLEAADVPSEQVDCVVDELEGSLTDEQLEEAEAEVVGGGSFPQEILDASTAAAQKCLTP